MRSQRFLSVVSISNWMHWTPRHSAASGRREQSPIAWHPFGSSLFLWFYSPRSRDAAADRDRQPDRIPGSLRHDAEQRCRRDPADAIDSVAAMPIWSGAGRPEEAAKVELPDDTQRSPGGIDYGDTAAAEL